MVLGLFVWVFLVLGRTRAFSLGVSLVRKGEIQDEIVLLDMVSDMSIGKLMMITISK